MSDVKDWAVSAGGNTSTSPDGFPEGMPPSGVNDSAREVMAAVARKHRQENAYRTATATTTTNVTYIIDNPDISVGAIAQGMVFGCILPRGNTGTASLQIAGVSGSKFPLKRSPTQHMIEGELESGAALVAAFLSAEQYYQVVSPVAIKYASQAQQESSTATAGNQIAIVTTANQHHHRSSAKAWGVVTESGGTYTLRDSYNITSITKNSTGNVTVTIGTDFSSAFYSIVMTGEGAGVLANYGGSPAAGTFVVRVSTASTGAGLDAGFSFACYGDQ